MGAPRGKPSASEQPPETRSRWLQVDETATTPGEHANSLPMEMLAEVFRALERDPDSGSRGARARAETYSRELETWNKTTPTPAQRRALLELVLTLHESVVGRASRRGDGGAT
jgi:hypothetical protein